MPITLGLNISSVKAQRQLAQSNGELSSVFERLSSGQRINRASDDAAGLAIADSLNASARVFTQGIRNLNDGISILNVADGALNELTNITTRLTELAEQAANGTLGVTQRAALDEEAQALSEEYLRIVQSTKFNDRQILAADYGELRLQAGYGLDASIGQGLGGAIGTGGFQAPELITTESPQDIVLGDLNGDGNLDLVSTDTSVASEVLVRFGTGNGTFGEATTYAVGTDVDAVELGDLDNDGHLDVVVANHDEDRITILQGNGDGTLTSVGTFTVEGGDPGHITLDDINNDGLLDIGVGSELPTAYTILENNGNFEFTTIATGTASGSLGFITSLQFADIDGDGHKDIIGAGTSRVGVLYNDGNDNFGLDFGGGFIDDFLSQLSTGFYLDLQVGDLDNDGLVDIAAVDFLDDEVDLFLSGNSYGKQSYTTPLAVRSLELGDLNGDGFLDIATRGGSGIGSVGIHINTGSGDFEEVEIVPVNAANSSSEELDLADINNDGVLDIVTSSAQQDRISILLAETTDGVSSLLDFSLTSIADAKQALSQFTQKIDQLSEQRGQLGAFQARVEVAENVLQVTTENYRAAESRIRDADIAQEAADLVRLQILQQAGASVLGQANLQPQLVLQLLGGGR